MEKGPVWTSPFAYKAPTSSRSQRGPAKRVSEARSGRASSRWEVLEGLLAALVTVMVSTWVAILKDVFCGCTIVE